LSFLIACSPSGCSRARQLPGHALSGCAHRVVRRSGAEATCLLVRSRAAVLLSVPRACRLQKQPNHVAGPASYTTDGSEAGHTLLLDCLLVHLCEHLDFFCCTLLLGLLVTSQLFASCYQKVRCQLRGYIFCSPRGSAFVVAEAKAISQCRAPLGPAQLPLLRFSTNDRQHFIIQISGFPIGCSPSGFAAKKTHVPNASI